MRAITSGRDIVCIGASAGGLQPLREVISELPASLPASLFVVVHTGRDSPGMLPQLLRNSGFLAVEVASDHQRIEPGHVYVPPPDHHLLVKPNRMRVVRGPRENSFRPAIDPLFRSAARSYGARVAGVVLSGGMHDGTAGLLAIKHAGGKTIVQDPADAVIPQMPLSALARVDVDHVLGAKSIAQTIVRLTREKLNSGKRAPRRRRGAQSLDPAEFVSDRLEYDDFQGPPSEYACPECGGTLWESGGKDLMQFRCHLGHAYSAESLLVSKDEEIEGGLWAALRTLEENVSLRRRMAARAEERWPDLARMFGAQADEASRQADVLRKILVEGGEVRRHGRDLRRNGASKRGEKSRSAASAGSYLPQRE